MEPNFCTNCGHRLYQHNAEGCEHVDVVDKPCSDPQCGDSTWDHDCDMGYIRTSCGCREPHPLMAPSG